MSDALKPKPVEDQPPPEPGQETVWPMLERLFQAMLPERVEEGIKRYGTPLQTFNGRDAFQDSMQEWFDLGLYVTQMSIERTVLEALVLALLHDLEHERTDAIQRDIEEIKCLLSTE